MLKIDGISRQSKWRGLVELEKVGLVTIERRPNRSPIVRVNLPLLLLELEREKPR